MIIKLPISSKHLPWLHELLKAFTFTIVMDSLFADSLGQNLFSIFNITLLQRLLFQVVAFSAFYLIVREWIEFEFIDENSD